MAWVVSGRGTMTYGDGIRTPSGRRYPFRLGAALVARFTRMLQVQATLTKTRVWSALSLGCLADNG
jgi:hypothetical protein